MDSIIDKIKWLIDKENGMGIPVKVIAKYCHCHPTTLTYYLEGGHEPKEKINWQLSEGIYTIYQEFLKKMGE